MHIEVVGDTLCALVSAGALASIGHQVFLKLPEGGVREKLFNAEEAYTESGLQALLDQQLLEGRLIYHTLEDVGVDLVDAAFLALEPYQYYIGTSYLQNLYKKQQNCLVVNQSSFPIGSSESLLQLFPSYTMVAMPEMMQEGVAIQSFTRPDYYILGCQNGEGADLLKEILRPFNRRKDIFLLMSLREAEFTKLAISGMLATRVSFMNDMANVADALGVDIERVRVGMGSDPRIGEAYLYPGCGFGGRSFSRDVVSLAGTITNADQTSQFLEYVLTSNEQQKEVLFRKLWRYYQCDLKGKIVAIWGAAFKPNTDKIDNAPVLRLLDSLWAQGVTVQIHDPKALPALKRYVGEHSQLVVCEEPYQAAQGAHALCIVTEWKQYWSPDYKRLKSLMTHPLILDGRNIYDPSYVKSQGFIYQGVGRG